uniref:Uncharacterized protein n=1 Tax=Grammatophora oceanica TaxID=210454 RepID=A0A7S1VBN9_9STRA
MKGDSNDERRDFNSSSPYEKRMLLATGVAATQVDPTTDAAFTDNNVSNTTNPASINDTIKSAFIPFDECDVECAGDVGRDCVRPAFEAALHPTVVAPISNGTYQPTPRRALPTKTSENDHHQAVVAAVHPRNASLGSNGLHPPTQQQQRKVPNKTGIPQYPLNVDLMELYTFNEASSMSSNGGSYFQDEYRSRASSRGPDDDNDADKDEDDVDDDEYVENDDDDENNIFFCCCWWSKLQLLVVTLVFFIGLLSMFSIGYSLGKTEVRHANQIGAPAPTPGTVDLSPSPSPQVGTATTRGETPSPATPSYALYLSPTRVVTATPPGETPSPTSRVF